MKKHILLISLVLIYAVTSLFSNPIYRQVAPDVFKWVEKSVDEYTYNEDGSYIYSSSSGAEKAYDSHGNIILFKTRGDWGYDSTYYNYSYDSNERITYCKETGKHGFCERYYSYDAAGKEIYSKWENHYSNSGINEVSECKREFDLHGNIIKQVIQIKDFDTNTTHEITETWEYKYDKNGEKIYEKHNYNSYFEESWVLEIFYKYENNVLKSSTEKSKEGETYTEYDSQGHRLYQILPNGKETLWKYDAKGKILYIKTKSPNGKETMSNYKYDTAGNNIYLKNSKGRESFSKYDSYNNKIYEKRFDTNKNRYIEIWHEYEYTAKGKIKKIITYTEK